MRANWKLAAVAPLAGLPLAAGCAAAPGTDGAAFRRYRADRHLAGIAPALDAYLATVVTPTLEAQKSVPLPGGEVRSGVP